jgi:hypothetical protein
MRIFGGLGIIIAFALWVLYRLYKKDLKQNMQAFYVYMAFAIVWTAIYGFMLLK